MKKKTVKKQDLYVVQTDMFCDGVIVFQETFDPKEFAAKLAKELELPQDEIKRWTDQYTEGGQGCKGFVMGGEGESGKVWLMVVFRESGMWITTLAHESLHAAEIMCSYRGIPICAETQELRAMLVDHLMNNVIPPSHLT